MNKEPNIIQMDRCPDAATMEAFIRGVLDPASSAVVSSHLENCPFCQDAAEGLEMIDPSHSISEITEELNQRIDKKVEKKSSRRFYWYSVAAVLIVALITGYLFTRLHDVRKSRQVTETVEENSIQPEALHSVDPPEIQSDQKVIDPVVIDEKPAPLGKDSESEKQRLSHPTDEVKVSEQETAMKDLEESVAQEHVGTGAFSEPQIQAAEAKDERKEVQSDLALMKNMPASNAAASSPVQDKKQSVKEDANMPAAAEMARDELEFSAVTKSSPEVRSKKAKGKSAIESSEAEAAYQSGDHAKVIRLTEKFSATDYKSQWFRANSLIHVGRSSDAVPLLEKLGAVQNQYTVQAQELLRKISTEVK